MTLRIADTFTDSLARLTNQEQAAAKQAAFDLHVDPASPGLSFHRVDRGKDKDFWTVRVNRDIRIVVHKRGADLLLAWVGHHDAAYRWAERRRLDVHPRTGAAQIVEVRERVEDIVVRRVVEENVSAPAPLAGEDDETLLAYGVPEDWLEAVRAASEDALLDLAARLPQEAAEAVLNLAVGVRPAPPPEPAEDPYAHPDAQRRFRVMENQEELARALEAPWEKWTVFLHPAQREFVTRDFAGPARVIGSAGTGKTVVALYRAVRLARESTGAPVLLTTFNAALADALAEKLRRLVGDDAVRDGIRVEDLRSCGAALHATEIGGKRLASPEEVRAQLSAAAEAQGAGDDLAFVAAEWEVIVDGRDGRSAEAYRTVSRAGRRVRLAESRREALWAVFDDMRGRLSAAGLMTPSDMFFDLARHFADRDAPFSAVVVDEAQDISAAELAFLAAIAGTRPNGLFFAGDIGQRIFRPPFSWKSMGVEIRGRSRSLRVNYRTSHQIRRASDLLLPETLTEVDGDAESRAGVVSVFDGPAPELQSFESDDEEAAHVAAWLRDRHGEGIAPSEIGLIVRSEASFPRPVAALERAGLEGQPLSGRTAPDPGKVALATMHDAKGLEFRAVAVLACDDGLLPLESRITSAEDPTALEEIYATERHLLYVACTRAREHLLVTGVEPVSEFVEDLMGN